MDETTDHTRGNDAASGSVRPDYEPFPTAATVRELRPAQPVPVDSDGLADLCGELVEQGVLPYDRALTLIAAVLDRISPDDLALYDSQALLDTVEAALRVADRVTGSATRLLGEAHAREAAPLAYGTRASTWLTHRFPVTTRQAQTLSLTAFRAHSYPATLAAVEQGRVRPAQAAVIVDALRHLPDTLDAGETDRAEQTMIDFAASGYPTDDLARLGNRLIEVIDPVYADQLLEDKLERQHAQAWADRYLTITDTHDGAMTIKGRIPTPEGKTLLLQLDAVAAQQRRTTLELRDPVLPLPSKRVRRLDALVHLSRTVAAHEDAPAVAGDRPRITILMTIDQFTDLADPYTHATDPILGAHTPEGAVLPPSVIRRWLSDPDLQPLITDPTGRHTLGVGRTQRLAPPPLRQALALRDQGCAFPGCDEPPHLCDAHHIQPWWAGGRTELTNLALLCHQHHALVEPGREPRDQWHLRMGDDGIPEVVPPIRVDPRQRPVRHRRYNTLPRPS